MYKFLLLLCAFCAVATGVLGQQTSVLFVGNSYIYTADLPGTLSSLALVGGDSIYYDSSTPGGATFDQHLTNTSTLSKIASRDWDYVVLQQQSQMPAFPPGQVAWQTYPYAADLVDTIRANHTCTEPLFFMTWGRREGDQANCGGYPPLCTFEGMNARLRESYLEMAVDNDATVAPCGAAWLQLSISDTPFWQGLYTNDGSHPSAWGTYLNACVFYATIFRKTPVGIPYYGTIGQQDAAVLQQLAQDIVLDSLSNWRIGHADVVSNANYTWVEGTTINFTATTSNELTHTWDFGDGNSAMQANVQHTYAQPGSYSVRHIVSSNCNADTTFLQVSVGSNSITSSDLEKVVIGQYNHDVFVSNPTFEHLFVQVYDARGRILNSVKITPESTYVFDINPTHGIYFFQLRIGNNQFTKKLLLH